MSKNTNEQCQFLFQGLLKGKWSATSYIRELQETVHCDQFCDFKEIRAEVREFIDAEAMNRILAYNETQQDERRAEQAMVHIRPNHEVRLCNWRMLCKRTNGSKRL